jgi:hypothetical protein
LLSYSDNIGNEDMHLTIQIDTSEEFRADWKTFRSTLERAESIHILSRRSHCPKPYLSILPRCAAPSLISVVGDWLRTQVKAAVGGRDNGRAISLPCGWWDGLLVVVAVVLGAVVFPSVWWCVRRLGVRQAGIGDVLGCIQGVRYRLISRKHIAKRHQ